MRIVKKLALKYIRTRLKLLSHLSKKKAAEKAFELFTTPPTRVAKELSPIFLKAEDLTCTFNGVKTRGFRWNKGAGKKLLILHGFESSVVNFERFINPLVRLGYEVVGFDAPAHGRSAGKRIHAVDYKNFILQLNKEFGPFTSFITHSFGGLAISLTLEELPHNDSFKVVMIAPATESTTAMDQFFKLVRLDDEVRKEFNQLITEANGQPPEWYSVARASAHIKAQVLFLQDKDDLMTPLSDVQPIIDKKYPNFRFVISEGLGHRRIYRDQNSVKAILDFLK